MNIMFPVLIIAIGIAVLVFGKRLAVMGAAVGALLGVGLLRLLNIPLTDVLLTLLIPGLLAVIGFFVAGFAKGIINIVLLVLGALAGTAIVLAFLDLFRINAGLLDWILAIVGGVVGLILVRRYHDWALIILAGVIGGLLVTRGLSAWLPFLNDSLVGTLLVIVLAGGSIVYEGGFLGKRKAAAPASAPATKDNPPPPPAAK
ncbi:MAG: hypothetical protein HGB05_13315 [Chloroflexi bacterium]|jgi:hypothetical protein|nr:hypothetical protein [Chloroflexota bacterium]